MVLHIVTGHWKEDLEWLKQSKWPVVLIDKEGADPSWITPQHVIPNNGQEVSSYLKYIIENYDNLPDHVAFIHGHENAWHQCHDRPLLDVIDGAKINEYGFIPLNNWTRTYEFANEEKDYMKIEDMWTEYEFPFKRPPKFFEMECPLGAQFIVARDRILRNPKILYQKWYEKIQVDDKVRSTTFFELVWHIIFGEFWNFPTDHGWFEFKTGPTKVWRL
jgi:hypothetical protein